MGRRPPSVAWTLGALVALIGCTGARGPKAPEAAAALVFDRIDPGSPLGRSGIQRGDVLAGARRASARIPLSSFSDLWLLEAEEAPRGEVVLEVERDGTRFERTIPEERWRAVLRPGLTPELRALHDGAAAAVAAGRPAEAIAAYARLRDKAGTAPMRAWAEARAAQVQREGADAHWAAAAASAREAGEASLEAWIALKRCESLAEAGAFAAAPPHCAQARESRERLGQPLAAAEADYRAAVIAGRAGDPREEERRQRAVLEALAPLAPEGLLAVRTLRGLAKARATQGDLQGAFAHARRALALVERKAPRGLDHGASVMILGIFHWFAGEWTAAESRFLEARDLMQAVDPAFDDLSNVLSNLGLVSGSRGDLAAAEEYYRQGLEAMARLGAQDPLNRTRTLNNLATIAATRGDLETAIRYDREVLALRERLVPGSIDLAVPLLNLGGHLITIGEFDEAERALTRALALQRRHAPDSGDVARTLGTLAEAVRGRGDAPRAEVLATEAAALAARKEPDSELEARTLRTLGELRAEGGDASGAERLLRRSATLLQALTPGTLEEARSLHALGRLLRARGDRAGALEPLRGAARALDLQLATLGGTDEVRAHFRESWRHIHRDLADLLIELGREEEAFDTLERGRARAFLLLLRSRDLPLAAAVSPEIERERRALATSYDRVQGDIAKRYAAHDENALRELGAERRRLQLRRDQLAERLGRDAPRLAALQAVAGVAEARAALAGSAAALSYFVEEKRTRLAVVGARGTIAILDLPVGEAELRDLVDRFRFLVEAPTSAADPSPLGLRLHELLVAPAAPLLEGAASLLIVPDGPLHRLPFAALARSESGRTQFLVERMPIQIAASITAWIDLRRARAPAAGRFVAFADPALPDVSRLAARNRAAAVGPLPFSRREAERAAALFGADALVLAGSAASEPAARQAARGARVLHFATHALLDPVSPLDSALVLAPATDAAGRRDDGLLQAWEVVQDLRLDSELVALAACETGAGAAVADEGLLGLTRAFHFAGARAVLASLWKVGDRATATLMDRFYAQWSGGRSKADALRAAQLELIRGGERPASWAAFELHGDGR